MRSRPRWKETENRWVYQVMIDGKRQAFVSSVPGIQGSDECEDKARSALNGSSSNRNIRLRDAWKIYLDYIITKDIKGDKSAIYKAANHYGQNYILPKLRHKKVKDITDQNWQEILDTSKRKKAYLGRTELSKKTIKNMRNEIMLFCKFAKRSRWISVRPELEISQKYETIGKEILQPNDYIKFLSDEDPEMQWTYLFAWQLEAVKGYRPGEALGLKESDITDTTIDINRSINYENDITPGKNKNARRWSVLTEIDEIIIERQRKKKRSLGVISEWLFCQPDGSMPNHRQSYDQWVLYRKLNGLPVRATPYSMRHTYTTYQKNKLKLTALKSELGHAEDMDTLQTYGSHEYDGEKQEIADILNINFAPLVEKLRNIK